MNTYPLPSNQSGELWLSPKQSVELGGVPISLHEGTPFTVGGWFRIPEPEGISCVRQGEQFRLEIGDGRIEATVGTCKVTSLTKPMSRIQGDVEGRVGDLKSELKNEASQDADVAARLNVLTDAISTGGEFTARLNALKQAISSDAITVDLVRGGWYHIAVVSSSPASGQAKLQLYLDGLLIDSTLTPVAQVSGGTPQDLSIEGGPTVLAVRRLSLFSKALDWDEVQQTRYQRPEPQPHLEGAWDFAVVPAADESGHSRPITYKGGAEQKIATPGLKIGGIGCARGNLGTADLGQTPFTIQTWVRFMANPAAKSWVVCVGDSGAPQVGLTVDQAAVATNGASNISVAVGGQSFGLNLNLDLTVWTNLAVTFDPASGLGALYVDGKLAVQTGSPMMIGGSVSSQVSIGAAADGTGGFHGMIQNVVVWPRVLTAAEVEENLYPISVGQDEMPLAAFDFSLAPATELIRGEPLSLVPTAKIDTYLMSVPQALGTKAKEVEQKRVSLRAKRQAAEAQALAGFKMRDEPLPAVTALQPEAIKQIVEEIAGGLKLGKGVTGVQRQQIDEVVDSVLARVSTGGLPTFGEFITQRFGDEYVTFFRDARGGVTPLVKQKAAPPKPGLPVSDCTMWVIDMGATLLFGLLSVLNVPVGPAVVYKAINRLFASSKVLTAIARVLVSTITTSTCVALFKSVYDADYLTTFVKDIFSEVRWWDFAWMVASLILELIGLFVPGATLTLVLAKLTVLVVQLGVSISRRPSGCPLSILP